MTDEYFEFLANMNDQIKFYNDIDEYLKKEEVTYDGEIISAYDLNRVIECKEKYINELLNPDNYIIDKNKLFSSLNKAFACINQEEEIDSLDIRFSEIGCGNYTYGTFNTYNYLFIIKTNNNIKLWFRLFKDYHDGKYRHEVNLRNENGFAYDNSLHDFISSFVDDNHDILENLFFTIKEIYELLGFDSFEFNKISVEDTIESDDWKVEFLFDLRKGQRLCDLFYTGKCFFRDSDYLSEQKDEILKRIGVHIKDLNPFYQREIHRYYNAKFHNDSIVKVMKK